MFCLQICMMWFSVCTCFLIKPVATISFVIAVRVCVRLSTSSSSVQTGRLFAKILYRGGMFTRIFRRFQFWFKSKKKKVADPVCEDLLTFMTAWLMRLPLGVAGHKNDLSSCDSYDHAKALEFFLLCLHFGRFRLVKSVFYY